MTVPPSMEPHGAPCASAAEASAEASDSGDEEASREASALRQVLSSASATTASIAQLGRALRRARRNAEVEQRRVAGVWREPLALFDAAAEAKAEAGGIQAWALEAARRARQLSALTTALGSRAASYEEQLDMARRQRRQVARAPLLRVLARLDSLAEELRAMLPSLGVARVAFDTMLPKGHGVPKGIIEPFTPTEQLVAPAPQDFGEEEVPPANILEPRHVVGGLLEATVDVLESFGRAAGLAALPAAAALPTTGDLPAPGRPSHWLRVLETASDARQRSRHLLGDIPCLVPIVRPPRLTTGYWKFRGLGAPMRMICMYAGVECKDVKYEVRARAKGGWSAREWEREDKRGLLQKNPLMQLPYVVNHATGEVVTQSSAICLYLGRLLGLNGACQSARTANEQVLIYVHALWTELRDLVYTSRRTKDEQEFRENLGAHFGSTLPDHYEKLESWLGHRGTGGFAGWGPCVADFHVWELLDQQEAMAKAHDFRSPLADFELLEAFHARFRALPRLQEYFESEDAQLPINNKMAFFK